jgi:hypothetical protein
MHTPPTSAPTVDTDTACAIATDGISLAKTMPATTFARCQSE